MHFGSRDDRLAHALARNESKREGNHAMSSGFAGSWKLDHRTKPVAVIIEPQADLADIVHDIVEDIGFEVILAVTHFGAATAVSGRCPELLIACVPAFADDAKDAYLAACRRSASMLPTVLMLSDAVAGTNDVPQGAAKLLKPFTRGELLLAIDGVLSSVEHSLAD